MPTEKDIHCDVAIIGYGPTGAVLANLLAQCEIRVAVIEREESLYPLPRAVHFDAECMRVFETVGISDALKECIRVNTGMRFVDTDGTLLLDWPRPPDIGPQGWHPSYRLHQPDLERLLRGKLTEQPGVQVINGCTVTVVVESGDGVEVLATHEASGRITRIHAGYTVGCDGARSAVRAAMGATLENLGFSERWLVVDTILKRPMPELGDHTVQFCNPDRPMTYCRNMRDRRRWEFTLHDNEDTKSVTTPERLWAFLARWITPSDADIERSAVYTFQSALADRWRRGRVMIAGDAAHLTPPFMGQGMCAGIRDAANLAWKLALCVKGRAEGSLLDSYAQERGPHVTAYIETAVRLGGLINSIDRESALALASGGGSADAHFKSIAPRLGGSAANGVSANLAEHAGTLFPQPLLANSQRLDSAVGYAPALITRLPLREDCAIPQFDATTHPDLLEPLDVLAVDAVLIRPDRYIQGTASGAGDIAALTHRTLHSPLR